MYDLNDNGFDAKQGVTIFNGGVAGLVNDLKMSVYKKTKEDKENAPDYKVVFTDAFYPKIRARAYDETEVEQV